MTTLSCGFIGLGDMGLPMTAHLVRAGYRVTGYDLNSDAVDKLVAQGGVGATSSAEAARDQHLLCVMVHTMDQVDDVLFASGAAESLAPNGIVLLFSTTSPEYAVGLAERLSALGKRFIESPLTGGIKGAVEGKLRLIVSGPDEVYDEVAPALDALSEKIFRIGSEPGQGAAVKMVNQLIGGVHCAAAAEALAFATKIGADPQKAFDVISTSMASSTILKMRGPRMLVADFENQGALINIDKDLKIAVEMAEAAGLDVTTAKVAAARYDAAVAAGYGREDDCAILKSYIDPELVLAAQQQST